MTYTTTLACAKCHRTIYSTNQLIDTSTATWLLQAHWWQEHGHKAPEGLGD